MRSSLLMLALALLVASCGTGSAELQDGDPREGLTAHRNPYTLHRSIATALLSTHNVDRALSHIQRMLEEKPDKAEPHYLLAKAMYIKKARDEAKNALDRALELDPSFAPAMAYRGVMLDDAGKHVQAEKWHRRAVKHSPKVASYLNNLGFCLYLQQRYEAAVSTFRQALKLRPDARRVHNNLGFALARAGDLKGALTHLKLAAGAAAAHNNLGLALEMGGHNKQAFAHYIEALKLDADYKAAQANLRRVSKKVQWAGRLDTKNIGTSGSGVLPQKDGQASAGGKPAAGKSKRKTK